MAIENIEALPENPATRMVKQLVEEGRVRSHHRVRAAWLLHAAIAFIFSSAILAYIQFAAPNIVDYDGYYHIKTAQLMREQGLPLDFPYLKFTIMDREGYTDPHLGMHILQMPFTFLSDLVLAAKLAPVCFAAITLTIFYLLLRHYGIRLPFLWLLLLLASSSPFLYRLSMARGQALSLGFQLLAFHLIVQRRAKWLFALTVLFVWTYNAFPMLVPMVFFGMVIHFVSDKKIDYKLPLALAAGIIAGHIVNPYYPRNILFIWDHIVPKLFAVEYETAVGSEWYPYNSWAMLTMSLVAFLAYAAGIFFTNVEEWKTDKARLFWFLVSTMYLVLLMKSRRFVEYFPPSAILFCAFAVRHRFQNLDFSSFLTNKRRAVAALATVVLLLFATQASIAAARKDVASEPASLAYRGGAEWLAQNTSAGATVFHTDWDDFPMLYFYNTHNRYIVGLDPDFMRLKDEKLFRRYEDITLGRVREPEDEILYDFGCEYVFTDNDHGDFINIANQRPRMQKVFSDRYTTVYRILDKAPVPLLGATGRLADDGR
jgi:asparagine N-glycosylation enzyme membrane subunit Stt3